MLPIYPATSPLTFFKRGELGGGGAGHATKITGVPPETLKKQETHGRTKRMSNQSQKKIICMNRLFTQTHRCIRYVYTITHNHTHTLPHTTHNSSRFQNCWWAYIWMTAVRIVEDGNLGVIKCCGLERNAAVRRERLNNMNTFQLLVSMGTILLYKELKCSAEKSMRMM